MIQIPYRQRLGLLTVLLGCGMLLLTARLVLLQVLEGEEWTAAAEELRSGWRPVRPIRGRILDASGVVLAHDSAGFDLEVLALPWRATRYECSYCGGVQHVGQGRTASTRCRRCREPGAVVAAADERDLRPLARELGLNPDDLRKRVERRVDRVEESVEKRLKDLSGERRLRERERLMHDHGQRPQTVVRDVSYEVAREVDLHPRRYPAFRIHISRQRRYPGGADFAQLLGRVAATRREAGKTVDNRILVERDDGSTASLVLDRGCTGLEYHFQEQLQGEPGWVVTERDPRQRLRRVVGEREPGHGQDLQLTIDRATQRAAAQALGRSQGALVVVEAETGRVLALATRPSYDPERYRETVQHWNRIAGKGHAEETPFIDRSYRSFHAPGSIMKPFTALAALDSGVVVKDEEIVCEQDFYLGDRKINGLRCNGRHGPVDMHRALVRSCNVYFQTLMARMLESRRFPVFEELGRRFGFGRPTGIEAERGAPHFPDHWRFDTIRRTGTFILTAVGQGTVLLSPAQVARAYAGLATGFLPRLFVVSRVGDRAHFPERVHLGLREIDRERIVASLRAVPRVGGTAGGWGLERWNLACKTGTAELVRGARINNAWLVGFAPAQHGRPAIAFAMVALRTHLHGGEACGPRLAEFLRAFYERYAQ